MTTSSGTMSPGSSITHSCTVGVVEGLIVQPAIVWTKQAVSVDGDTALNNISVGAVRTNNTVTLSFNSINTSDAGQYTCTATVNVSAINITVTNTSMVDIRLQSEWVHGFFITYNVFISSPTVPSPTVSLTLSSADSTVSANSSTSQSYLAGSTLTITCDIDVPLSINTMINVIMEWTRDGSDIENSSRVSFTTATETTPSHYQTQLVFSTLSSSMDSGNYECSVTINSNNSLLYVEDSTLVNESTTVSVQGTNYMCNTNFFTCTHALLHYWFLFDSYIDPAITNFTIDTTLLSSCTDSDPLNYYTLVCRAMKPAVVIPQLLVQWFRSGTQRVGDVPVGDNGAYIVNTLNVSENKISDAGLYKCVASIAVPDSPIIMTTTFSTLVIMTVSGKVY